MFDKMNPIVKAVVMFVIGFVLVMAAEWVVSLIKHTDFLFNWLHFAGGGALVAILDFIFPAAKRKENRDNLKNKFK